MISNIILYGILLLGFGIIFFIFVAAVGLWYTLIGMGFIVLLWAGRFLLMTDDSHAHRP